MHALDGAARHHVCTGFTFTELAQYVIADGERAIAKTGNCVFLVDTLDSTRMETGFREQMMKWFSERRGKVVAHMLLRSKFVEMAINVANMVVGTSVAKAYSDVGEWERVGKTQFGPTFRRRPMPQSLDAPVTV